MAAIDFDKWVDITAIHMPSRSKYSKPGTNVSSVVQVNRPGNPARCQLSILLHIHLSTRRATNLFTSCLKEQNSVTAGY